MALNVMAHNMSRWVVRIARLDIVAAPDHSVDGPAPTVANPPPHGQRTRRQPGDRKTFVATDTLRRRHFAIPGRLASSARKLTVHLPARWPWAKDFNSMIDAIRAVELVT